MTARPTYWCRRCGLEWGRVRLLDTDGWVDRNAVIAAGLRHKSEKAQGADAA